MDLSKAKIYLDKINREFAKMNKDPENIARIDVDIMQAYIRDLYEMFLSADINKVVSAPQNEPVSQANTRKPVEFSPERPPARPQTPPPPPRPAAVQEEPIAAAPPPIVQVEQPRPAAPPVYREPEPVYVAPPPPPVEKIVAKPIIHEPYYPNIEEVQAPKPAAQRLEPMPVYNNDVSDEAEVLFEQKKARELSEKLAERPIPDLTKGIGLNEKLLMTRELFGGNKTAFDEALAAMNGYSGFEQAKQYMVQNCVNRFGWLEKGKSEHAKEFIRIVRRRYT
jgi:hypothetical protein